MPFDKNNKQGKGRPAGAKNQTSKQAKELYLKVIEGQSEHIEEAFNELRKKDVYQYLNTLNKFASYVIPKLTEQEINPNKGWTPIDFSTWK